MKRLICCLAIFASCTAAFSQKQYFAYLQTETAQPFFVKMGDKVYSSTATGYLILSQLRDSLYNFKVGFPQNKWPEQQFSITVKGGDHGYLLKNFGDKGWGLFDLQTLTVQMGNDAAGKAKTEMRPVSAFTEVLSKASNDPSLRERPIAVKEDEKPVEAQQAIVKEGAGVVKQEPPVTAATVDPIPVKSQELPADKPVLTKEKKDTPAVAVQAPVPEKKQELTVAKDTAMAITKLVEPAKQEPVVKEDTAVAEKTAVLAPETEIKAETKPVMEEYKRSSVIKKTESSTSEGIGATYIDQDPRGTNDTIRIVIPNTKATAPVAAAKPAEQKKFLDITTSDKDASTAVPIGSMGKAPVKSKCQAVAGEGDFLKLRKKMAAETKDDAMIEEVRKAFKGKCYTADQVRNLGNLFLTEPGKFQFYEVAYPSIADPDKFPLLETEFKDPYFVHRFKGLVK